MCAGGTDPFFPSMDPVSTTAKIPSYVQPRCLEDEGLFVGERPWVSNNNMNIMENRLMADPLQALRWFGGDGRILSLANPIKPNPTRLFTFPCQHPDPDDALVYRKVVHVEHDERKTTHASRPCQLDVDVHALTFFHHPLFSREHMLASRLQQLHGQFEARQQARLTAFLTDKIHALREAVKSITGGLQLHSPNVHMQQQSQEYIHEIRKTRSLRDMEEQKDRNLLKSILKVWKEMKTLREFQKFTNTSLKLNLIRKEDGSGNREEEYEEGICEEIQQIHDEFQQEYQKQLELFHQHQEHWKSWKKNKRMKLRSRQRRHRQNQMETELMSNEEKQNEEEEEEEEEQEPALSERPSEFDRDKAERLVRERVSQSRWKPGQVRIIPQLSETAAVTLTDLCPRVEQQRREELQRHSLFVRLLVNNKEVSRTAGHVLDDSFHIHFGQIFNVQIKHWPESIQLQVLEVTSRSSDSLANLFVPIPETSVLAGTALMQRLEFSSEQRVTFEHEATGSNIPVYIGGDMAAVTPLTSGTLACSVAWGMGADGTVLVPDLCTTPKDLLFGPADAITSIGAVGVTDTPRLARWIRESRLDPNDPNNATLMQLHMVTEGGQMTSAEFFRLEQLQEEFDFVSEEELLCSRRLRLLRLRNQEQPEFRACRLVPLMDREIPEKVFLEYEKRQNAKNIVDIKEHLIPHRAVVAQYILKVREEVLCMFVEVRHQYTLSDVVIEEQSLNLRMLGMGLFTMAEKRRPLKPKRKERLKVATQNLSAGDVKLLVNISKAYNLPRRQNTRQEAMSHTTPSVLNTFCTTPPRQSSQGEPEHAQDLLRPFVEVSFQRRTCRTTTAHGPNPSWHEELQLPFRALNGDYSSTTLQSLRDEVYINLFDELTYNIQEGDRETDGETHTRTEKVWLGFINIPFNTLYLQSRIEGTFKINVPKVLLGYRLEQEGLQGFWHLQNPCQAAFLSVYLTTEPLIIPGEPVREKFESHEESRLLFGAEAFRRQCHAAFPNRRLLTTVMDITGQTLIVTRYLHPLKPPSELLEINPGHPDSTVKLLARFISLIPFTPDSVTFSGICDLWTTCDQFLTLLCGDEEEHSVLLCCFFLALGKKSWLLLGSAIPEGPTAYVLTKEDDMSYLIWNASSGQRYQQFDSFCPLQSVGSLVGTDNIWFNMQACDSPMRVNFDVSKTKLWKPLFSHSFPNPGLGSVQPQTLSFQPTDRSTALELQDRIEKVLKEKVMEWRPLQPTRWNRHCTAVLRRALPDLEFGLVSDSKRSGGDLQHILNEYQMCGFPLQMPFSELWPIVERVHSTGVHECQVPNVEFALAVYVHPYPSNVMSVWVYIASLKCLR
uniref:coiled-coil and C2 domain-containing protein 2A n=1 Tax=Myxine glutinosa TaxID=7769 RepID=UPI00358EC959